MTHGAPRDLLSRVERHLIEWFDAVPDRASVSFVGVEPIEVLRFAEPGGGDRSWSLVTLGMSRQPMTTDSDLAAGGRPRAELLLRCGGLGVDAWRQLAVCAAAPVVEGVVYQAGSTVDLGAPLCAGARCTGGIIEASDVPTFWTEAEQVDILRLLPATSTELAWCRVRGAAALRERWAREATDLLDLSRAAVRLG